MCTREGLVKMRVAGASLHSGKDSFETEIDDAEERKGISSRNRKRG